MTLKRRLARLEEQARPAGEAWIVDVHGLTEAEAERRIAETAARVGPGVVLLIDDGTDPGPFRPRGQRRVSELEAPDSTDGKM